MTSPPQDPNQVAVVGTTQVGQRGRYEILRELGRGGMATVYLASQVELDRFVALKQMSTASASDPSWAQRFMREARIVGSLSHPNIVTVFDYFVRDGTPYIAMEYVENGSLRRYIGHITLAQIGGVLEGLLAGLAHAQARGIVHRDLKPENLMVTADGRVKIADFGIAKLTTEGQTDFQTKTGTTVGTPHYMAPEQAMARKEEIGPSTDLYSVGCMAFELFTGQVPFRGTDEPMAVLLRHINEPVAPITSLVPDVDQRISDWVETLLLKEPADRPQSAQQCWDELEDILLSLLGPRWRREARLIERAPEETGGAKPLTPAAFERPPEAPEDDEFVSFSRSPPPGPPAPPRADTPAPPRADTPAPPRPDTPAPPRADTPAPPRADTPAPPPVAAPEPPPPDPQRAPPPEEASTVPPQTPPPRAAAAVDAPRSHRRTFSVLAVLLVAVVAGTAAVLLRPNGDEDGRQSRAAKPSQPTEFTTAAFSVELPPGWEAPCLDQAGTCSGREVPDPTRGSAFIEGSGPDAPRITIDRTPVSPERTIALMADNQERALRQLDGYRRSGSIRMEAISPARRARTFAFTSSERAFRSGAVHVFKAGGDIYVVTGTAPTPAAARELARSAAASVRPG